MSNFLLIRHKVRDFPDWKSAYDGHEPQRGKAGLTEVQLLRGVDDPSQVVVLFRASDLERARAFLASSDLRQAMERAGVVDRPEVLLLQG